MDGSNKKKRVVVIQKYTLKQLIDIYCTTKYLLLNDIKKHEKEIGEREGNYYDAEQVEKIFNLIRLPSSVEVMK